MIKKCKFIGLFIPFLLFLAACGSGGGSGGLIVGSSTTHEVGSIADSRFGTGSTLDGSEMVTTRSKLLESTNFGQSGTVAFTINITDTASTLGSVTAALLSAFDVFFIGNLDDSDPKAFMASELTAFENWVRNNGGVVIVTCDDASYDAVCAFFGYPASSSATPTTVPEAASGSHPIFAGSFGTVTSVSMGGTKGYFSTTTDATVLGEDSTGSPVATVLEKQIGNGWVIFISDLDMITESGGISTGTGILNDNDRFLGNLFEYAIDIL